MTHSSVARRRAILAAAELVSGVVRLDFVGFESIGQAFADEVFRVFVNAHPRVTLEVANASEKVQQMIRRAQSARAAMS